MKLIFRFPKSYALFLLLEWMMFFCPAYSQSVASAIPLDLAGAIRKAETSNPQLLTAKRNIDVLQAGKEIASAGPNPRLSVDYPFGLAETVHSITLEQPIELGGKRRARLNVAEDQLEQVRLQYESLRWQIRSDARQAYMEMVIGGASAREAENAVGLNQQLLDITKKRLKAGDVAESEVIQAEFSLGRTRQKLVSAANRRRQAEIRLNLLLGFAPETRIEPNEPLILSAEGQLFPVNAAIPDLQTLKQLALSSRVDLAIQRNQLKIATDQASLARSGQIPDVTAAAGYLWDPTIHATSSLIGVRMDIPIFNTRGGDVKQARAAQEYSQAQTVALEQQVSADVTAAYENYLSAKTLVEEDRSRLLPQGEEVLKLAQKSYELGQSSLTDVLVAQQAVLDQRDSYFSDLLTYETALGGLERAVNHTLENDANDF